MKYDEEMPSWRTNDKDRVEVLEKEIVRQEGEVMVS